LLRRGLCLRLAHVRCEVERLAGEVRPLDRVVVDDADPPDAGAGQVGGRGRPERARADHDRRRIAQPLLRRSAPLGQYELTRVAVELALSQHLTTLTALPSTRTRWPSSSAERGTLSSGSPSSSFSSRTSPGAIRSSASRARTQFI